MFNEIRFMFRLHVAIVGATVSTEVGITFTRDNYRTDYWRWRHHVNQLQGTLTFVKILGLTILDIITMLVASVLFSRWGSTSLV
jgi:hypothetical protein